VVEVLLGWYAGAGAAGIPMRLGLRESTRLRPCIGWLACWDCRVKGELQAVLGMMKDEKAIVAVSQYASQVECVA